MKNTFSGAHSPYDLYEEASMIWSLMLSLLAQDTPSVSRDKWEDLSRLWKDVATVVQKAETSGRQLAQDAKLDDAFLEVSGRVHTLFKDAKDNESVAMKGIITSRLLHAMRFMSPEDSGGIQMRHVRVIVRGGGQQPEEEEKVDVAK